MMNEQDHNNSIPSTPGVVGVSREDSIERIETTIVDIPLKRAHSHSTAVHSGQSYVVVKLMTKGGAVGYGEGVTPAGNPFWGGESVESIKSVIDRYIAPALIGCNVFANERVLQIMDRAAAKNNFAKAAIDIAVHDVVGKLLNLPISALYGGQVRDSIPVLWVLATGEFEADVEDALKHLNARSHRMFKIKLGMGEARAEVKRAVRTVEAIHAEFPEACLTIDLNQAWDEQTATRWLPVLQDAGVEVIEQPVAAWNVAAMSRLASRLNIPILADEGLWDLHDAYDYFSRGATSIYAVKVAKGGGIRRAYKAAAVAEAAGIPLWGGMALESSFGTAASLQLFSALPDLPWGCEMIGPKLIADDLTTEPTRYIDYEVVIPNGPGVGCELDFDKVKHYQRS